jgi:diguanylate cyclase (GGDEF)-like protein
MGWKTALRLLRAAWLCLALAWGAGSAMAANDSLAFPPQVVALGAGAQLPLNGHSLYWIDEGAALRVEQVAARAADLPWRVRSRDAQAGTHGSALWILFEATVPPGQRWYLEAAASVNERLELFYQDAGGAWVRQQAGTGLAVTQWSLAGRLPTFRLAPGGPQPVRYLLRVEDQRSDFMAPLILLREDALQDHREREQFVFGAYFGLLALVAIAALINGTVFRDGAFLALALYIALLGSGQLARIGLAAQHLWPDRPDWNERVLALWPGAAVAAALWMIKILTNPARLSRGLDLGVWALIVAVLGATAVNVAVNTRASLTLVLALTGLALVAVFSMVLWGWLAGRERHLGLVALAMMPVAVLAAFPLLRALGLTPTNLVSRFGLFFGTVLELPLLYYALNARLATRRETELRAAALSRTDPLTGLPHRRALVERLDASLAHARAQRQACALLGVRISNLDAIAGELGQDAVDKALLVAASHLRRASVGFDMAARVGEREFAVFLEAPVTREVVASRAQQVVASGLQPVEALPGTALKFHVTVGMLPRPQRDGAGSLDWVLGSLDQITPDARKMIRTLDSQC